MVSALGILLAAALTAGASDGNTPDDPVLRALVDELARFKSLKTGTLDAPYYLSGAIVDVDQVDLQAEFGELQNNSRTGYRSAKIEVRVGSPALDNTNFTNGGFGFGEMMHGMGDGAFISWEADYDAIRQGLWLAFDRDYKQAVESLAGKRAYLQTNVVEERPPDFGPAKVSEVILPRATLTLDEAKWTRILEKASAVFREGNATAGMASLRATAENQAFASSDPVRTRFGRTSFTLMLTASAAADDGMRLKTSYEANGLSESELPSEAQVVQAARELRGKLELLAKAPSLAEDYSGPVLFTGRAADWFFLKGIGEPLSHPRAPLGEARSARMVDRLGKHVTATMVTARDDPTQRTWHGKPLLGWFPVDDEGVVPQPITLVSAGVLKTYYMSRIPTQKVAATNGHARDSSGGVGNLFVETRAPESRAALKRKLIALAKENDQEYGLLIEDFASPNAEDREAFLELLRSHGHSQNGDIKLPSPTLVYRVFLDGREELVRGASFKPVSFQSLKEIAGMGDAPTVLNTTSGGQPVSVVAPAVLVKQLELKGPTEEFERPPAIPRPVVSATAQ